MDDYQDKLTIVIPETPDHNEEDVGPLTPRLAARALLGLSLPPHLQPPESGDQSPGSPASVTSVASPLTNNTLLTLALAKAVPRRPRGEKKPIPEDLKDGKYFERRKRNNLAAKKSRDQRKVRESQVCQRATLMEKENAVLRAQVGTLRDEAGSLRSLLLQRKIAKRKEFKIKEFHLQMMAHPLGGK